MVFYFHHFPKNSNIVELQNINDWSIITAFTFTEMVPLGEEFFCDDSKTELYGLRHTLTTLPLRATGKYPQTVSDLLQSAICIVLVQY